MPAREERWWLLDDPAEMARAAWDVASRLYEHEGHRRRSDCRDSEDFYEGRAADMAEAPSYNVIQASTDTLVAHTIRTKVRPLFVTKKGDWKDRIKAEAMQRAVEGDFSRAGIWSEFGVEFCYDAHLYEAGGIKLQPDYANKQILVERVFSWEFFVPPREARRGKPEQGFHIIDVDRTVLKSRIPADHPNKAELEKAIDDAPNAPMDWFDLDDETEDDDISDRILIADCWHRPSKRVDRKNDEEWDLEKASHDGVHLIIVCGAIGDGKEKAEVFKAEAWPFDHFGIAWYKPRKKRRSFWSRSVPETVVSAQIAINRMNKRIDSVMHLHAVPRVYVWNKAGINTEKISNAHDGIITGNQPAGQALQWMTPTSVPAEYLGRVDKIIAWCEKVLGLPEYAIAANKPKGIEHAPALQFLDEEHAIRHTANHRAHEEAIVEAARIWVDMARLLAKKVPDFSVMWGDSKDLAKIEWAKVDLDDSRFLLRAWPTNFFSQHPGAKLDRMIRMKQEGMITPIQALLFLGLEYPDIEMMLGDTVSSEENIRRRIMDVVEHGYSEDNAPDAYLALELAKTIGVDRINYYEANGLPEDKLDELRNWVEDVKAEIDRLALEQAKKQGALAMAAAGGVPPGGGAPPGQEPPPGPEGAPPPPGGGEPMPAPVAPQNEAVAPQAA